MLDRWRVEGFKSDESFYKYPACLLNISSTHGKKLWDYAGGATKYSAYKNIVGRKSTLQRISLINNRNGYITIS